MNANFSLLYSFFLLIGDFLALVSAFVLSFILRVKLDDRPLVAEVPARVYIGLFLLIIPFWLITFALLNLYKKETYENRFSEFARLVVGCFIGILFVIGADFVIERPILPARLIAVYGFVIGFLFVLLFRTLARASKRLLIIKGRGIGNVLIVGSTQATKELVHTIHEDKNSEYRIIGVVGDKRMSLPDDILRFSTFDEAVKALKKHNLHSIVQTELYADEAVNAEILDHAQANHIAYRLVPTNNGVYTSNITVELFQSIPVIAVHQTALIGWGRVAKRLFDIVAGLILLTLFSPFILFAALFLIVFDHGDPFYRQKRLSRFNNEVWIFKIRTYKHAYNRMTPEASFAKMGKPELAKKYRANGDFLENDPRVSWFGRFMRRTSIDEMPQILNVIKGDISLVGPRPLEPFELEKYPHKSVMLSVKTGLTGLAVISGRRDIPFDERRKIDLYYVQNWSFWLDITIILKTVVHVIKGSGAK
jgi:exopolysaccharide biosynthesis polyprenyl glycosylphosphotransferase